MSSSPVQPAHPAHASGAVVSTWLAPRDVVIIGGAGFIGSNLALRLLQDHPSCSLTLIDNMSAGGSMRIADLAGDQRVHVHEVDIRTPRDLAGLLPAGALLIHLASNPNIAAATTNPAIDFDAGTAVTNAVVEAARVSGIARIVYASGSGVYGDRGQALLREDDACLAPVSTYAASKIAGEALLSAYAEMFDIPAHVFRFGNVVGPRQTHGVGFDFALRLMADPSALRVLGDGTQSKTYVHVNDVIDGILLALATDSGELFTILNIGTDEYLTVADIASLAIELICPESATRIEFGDSPRGWLGDVPVMRMSSQRIRARGWSPRVSSRDAVAEGICWVRDCLRPDGSPR